MQIVSWDNLHEMLKPILWDFNLPYLLTFTTLWEHSTDDKLHANFLFVFFFSQKIGFDISCKLSQTICMKCWSLFYSAYENLMIFFSFSLQNRLTFHANWLLRIQFVWNVKDYFMGKIRKYIKMSDYFTSMLSFNTLNSAVKEQTDTSM